MITAVSGQVKSTPRAESSNGPLKDSPSESPAAPARHRVGADGDAHPPRDDGSEQAAEGEPGEDADPGFPDPHDDRDGGHDAGHGRADGEPAVRRDRRLALGLGQQDAVARDLELRQRRQQLPDHADNGSGHHAGEQHEPDLLGTGPGPFLGRLCDRGHLDGDGGSS